MELEVSSPYSKQTDKPRHKLNESTLQFFIPYSSLVKQSLNPATFYCKCFIQGQIQCTHAHNISLKYHHPTPTYPKLPLPFTFSNQKFVWFTYLCHPFLVLLNWFDRPKLHTTQSFPTSCYLYCTLWSIIIMYVLLLQWQIKVSHAQTTKQAELRFVIFNL